MARHLFSAIRRVDAKVVAPLQVSRSPLNWKIVSSNQNGSYATYHISCVQETNFKDAYAYDEFIAKAAMSYSCRVFVNDSGTVAPSPHKHGGVCVLLHTDMPESDDAVHLTQFDVPARYMVIKLRWRGVDDYLHNVYAPAKSRHRPAFFDALPTSFPQPAMHIVCGDSNTVLDASNDSSLCDLTHVKGTQACLSWLRALQVVDPWRLHHPELCVYTSPTRKHRLDYIMVSSELNAQCYKTSGYTPATWGGDHLAPTLHLSSSDVVTGKGLWRLRPDTLARPAVREWLEQELVSLDRERDPARNPVLVWQSWKRRIRRQLILDQKLRYHPSSEQLHTAPRTMACQRAHQLLESESPTPFFFRSLSSDLTRCPIDEVVQVDGSVTTKQSEVQDAHQRYWGSIFGDKRFTDPQDTHTSTAAQDRLLNSITRTLSDTQQKQFDEPLSIGEIERAIRELSRGRAPGADGLTAAFYQIDAPRFSRILLRVFEYQSRRGVMPPDQRKSVVSLLHKSDPRNVPSNFRPISLLPVDTKILSRVLTNRLKEVIATLVHGDQRGFVAGRTIAQSLRVMLDLQDHVTDEDHEAFVTFVDAEKAFDRVNWNYLWRVLDRMRIGNGFISWVRLLYCDTHVCLNINGWLQDRLTPGQSVKQGDPLSPLLFILASEPLANLIRQHPELGYSSSAFPCITGSYFADDAALISNSVESTREQLALV